MKLNFSMFVCSFKDDEAEEKFVPSTWKADATPTRPALKSPEKILANIDNGNNDSLLKKNVSFSERKKRDVYKYPAEIEEPCQPTRRQWGAPSAAVIQQPKDSYADFADWEFGNVDEDRELEIDSSK